MNKKRSIFVIVLVFLIVLGSLSVLFYINLNKKNSIEVEATVKLLGDNYIIVETDEGEEYSLNTNDKYNVGDRIDFVIKDVEKTSNLKVGTVVKINTISRDVNFSISDENNNNDVVEGTTTNDEAVSSDKVVNNDENTYVVSENDIIEYFDGLNNKISNYDGSDKDIGKSIKEGFVTIVDFLFYDGVIKGKTFKELSNSAKIKVLQLAFSIDGGIEKHFPGYKETISSNGKKIYTNFKAEATKLYLDITTDICNSDPDLCVAAKDGLADLKESFSLTWSFIKEAAGNGFSKLKEWYEIWRTV